MKLIAQLERRIHCPGNISSENNDDDEPEDGEIASFMNQKVFLARNVPPDRILPTVEMKCRVKYPEWELVDCKHA